MGVVGVGVAGGGVAGGGVAGGGVAGVGVGVGVGVVAGSVGGGGIGGGGVALGGGIGGIGGRPFRSIPDHSFSCIPTRLEPSPICTSNIVLVIPPLMMVIAPKYASSLTSMSW